MGYSSMIYGDGFLFRIRDEDEGKTNEKGYIGNQIGCDINFQHP